MDLKKKGHIFIDDISWILYSKNNDRDNFNSEINNYETFLKILDILNANMNQIEVSFDFISSGFCKIKKIENEQLSNPKKIIQRNHSIKNLIRKIVSK